MRKILVVDDEALAHQLISGVIRALGDTLVESAYNAREAMALAEASPPDLIITDISMPETDGLMFCRQVRAHAKLSETPILVLTARGELSDRYEGFLEGADDYLVKPFDLLELQLHIKALLRRAGRPKDHGAPHPELRAGPISLEPQRYLARVEGEEIKLTASELAILKHLVEHADQVIGAEALLTQALDYPAGVGNTQVIHTHMRNIRNKFRAAGVSPDFITSSWQGYLLQSA